MPTHTLHPGSYLSHVIGPTSHENQELLPILLDTFPILFSGSTRDDLLIKAMETIYPILGNDHRETMNVATYKSNIKQLEDAENKVMEEYKRLLNEAEAAEAADDDTDEDFFGGYRYKRKKTKRKLKSKKRNNLKKNKRKKSRKNTRRKTKKYNRKNRR